jgi:hypothetical protein
MLLSHWNLCKPFLGEEYERVKEEGKGSENGTKKYVK